MQKKLPKLLTYIFLAIFIVQLISLIVLLLTPTLSQAAAPLKLELQIPIDGYSGDTVGPTTIGEYIRVVYKYAIGTVGLLATVVMMFGGMLWIVAGGAPDKINNAKEWIIAALTGLVLALCSYLLLTTINPKLGEITPLHIETINNVEVSDTFTAGVCLFTSGCDNNTIQANCEANGGTWLGNDSTAVISNCGITGISCNNFSDLTQCQTTDGAGGYCINKTCNTSDGQPGEPCGEFDDPGTCTSGFVAFMNRVNGGRSCESSWCKSN